MRKILTAVAAVALLAVTGASGGCGNTVGSGQAPTSTTQSIIYTVEGKTAGNITYNTDGGGSQEQASDVKLPWSKTVNVPSGFAFVSLLAQNGGSGSVTCRIARADGTVIKEATSSGKYAIASCSGSVS